MTRAAFSALIALAFGLLLTLSFSPIGPPTRNACLWDHDTLRYEAKGMPDTVAALTGRFERFPPLYYEMRLARVTVAVEANPTDLALYDDAGVACDRLGRSDDAIAWMHRKRAQLDAHPDGEHEYRYLANLGTFHAHRWIRAGADAGDTSDLDTARDLIARAIVLNPDAHFGRERYQLLAIDWLRSIGKPDPYTGTENPGFVPTVFDADPGTWGVSSSPISAGSILESAGYTDAVAGLTGLITLGNAWESVDIVAALEIALNAQNDRSVARLAQLRVQELLASGHRSFHPRFTLTAEDIADAYTGLSDTGDVDSYYTAARAEADHWRSERDAYLLERLKGGRHPDTDPAFWGAWRPTSRPPTMPGSDFSYATSLRIAVVGTAAMILAPLVALAWLLRRIRRNRGTKAPA